MRPHQNHSIGLLRRSGNATVELTLLLPILLALTFGTAEYGYALYVKHTLQGAAREGARAAVVASATAAEVQTAIDNAMSTAGFATTKYNRPAAIAPTGWTTATGGTSITVQVTATWSQIGFSVLPAGGIPPNKTITGAATMRKEG